MTQEQSNPANEDLTPASVIVELIRETLAAAAQGELTGSNIAPAIRSKFPAFTPMAYGCVNLRAFLQRYAPEIYSIGRRGMDYSYSLSSSPSRSDALLGHADGSSRGLAILHDTKVWKTFASPRDDYQLFGHPANGELRVVGPNETLLDAPWVKIPPCSSEKHREIACEFISQVRKEDQQALEGTLDQDNWWIAYYQTLDSLGLASRWNEFRRTRIVDEFKQTLTDLGIPLHPRTDRMRLPKPIPPPGQVRSVATIALSVVALREVAHRVVDKLSYEDLRRLPVPIGSLLDSLNSD